MVKPNYQFEKRQKEMAKKSKREEKRRQKLTDTAAADDSPKISALPFQALPPRTDVAPSAALPDHVTIVDGIRRSDE